MMRIGVGSMSVKLFTDKLVFRRLEVLGVWSLDSATPATPAYPAHVGGSSGVGESCYHCCMLDMSYGYHKALIRKKGIDQKVISGWINYADSVECVARCD